MAAEVDDDIVEDRWLLILDDPVVGILPWIAFGLLPYVTSFTMSTVIAAGLAALIVGATYLRGERPKTLELSDVVLFAALILSGLINGDSVNNWLEDHADLVSNGGLTLLAVVSLLLRRPFTAPYTTARFPGLDDRLQERLDIVSTSAWAIGLGVATLVTVYGEYVLRDPNNLWTGWIFQAVPLVLAFNATLWFDRRAIEAARGHPEEEPSPWELLRNLVIWLAPIGVLAISFKEAPVWVGWSLIVLGLSIFWMAYQIVRRQHSAFRVGSLFTDPEELDVVGPQA